MIQGKRYITPIYWLVHGDMTLNNKTNLPPNANSGQHFAGNSDVIVLAMLRAHGIWR